MRGRSDFNGTKTRRRETHFSSESDENVVRRLSNCSKYIKTGTCYDSALFYLFPTLNHTKFPFRHKGIVERKLTSLPFKNPSPGLQVLHFYRLCVKPVLFPCYHYINTLNVYSCGYYIRMNSTQSTTCSRLLLKSVRTVMDPYYQVL